ncbi:hypothetical protein [Paucibacter sp. Y2R2-4]|uniref:hypothetical protein n=1 Tax=Paucibacter sp. Y2R2-4 TaxID=2893553 RepID=UPI0021E4BD97|nr:hypothetical protein [Paucibacter sp. Y2R2-4]MCV2348418.1 hypothetical protein [Paucibacter sp. Y2R2-4]
MANWTGRVWGSALLALAPLGAAVAAPLCEQLASQARGLPETAWRAVNSPMRELLRFESRPQGRVPAALLRELRHSPDMREALGITSDSAFEIERLSGTQVYRVDAFGGSANCQSSVFYQIKPKGKPKRIDAPFEDSLCATQSGAFGHPLGQAAYVVYGSSSALSQDEVIQLAPWTGRGWGAVCKLSLSFKIAYRISREFCADPALCASTRQTALALARAYSKTREPELEQEAHDKAMEERGLDTSRWAEGRVPDEEFSQALRRMDSQIEAPQSIEFPSFDADPRSLDVFISSYANVDVRKVPLLLNGQWVLAVVGQAGVAWRESTVTLVSLFLLKDGQLQPVASFQVQAERARLREALAAQP